ncbi:MAG: FAD-binding oxidoreductase [Burkholderiales bacterium]|nr:FAD-binding oxidoreductase [Burkholderiales bacterium]
MSRPGYRTEAGTLEAALEAWRQVLPPQAVITEGAALRQAVADTSALSRGIAAILRPASRDEVPALVRIAAAHRVPLYPVSTGRNWGYGTACPPLDGCVLVDLSALQGIECDPEAGLVTVEPGVTQRMLHAYLTQHGLRYMVPVTGAGPDVSLLGNALERGYGLTPIADHFAAVTQVEAVLPDGSLYQGCLTESGGAEVDRCFKWGLGPYLDGLFSQGAFGIVTRMTLALAPLPERVEAFFFGVAEDGGLEAAVAGVRDILKTVGGVAGSINLMNARRVLAMTVPYPWERVPVGGIMPQGLVAELARRHRIAAWTGVGALYGEAPLVRAAARLVRRHLRGRVQRLVFLTPQGARRLTRLVGLLPGGGGALGVVAARVDKTLRLLRGEPSDIALPLAYWRSGVDAGMGDPARDGCGLIWYPPLVPMIPERVRRYVELVHEVCPAYGMEPLITLSSLSPRCFDSTLPLLFRRDDPAEAARAEACYQALVERGRQEGFLPYRLRAQYMHVFTEADTVAWRLVGRLKQAIDPAGILAPGRYAPSGEGRPQS